MRLQAGIVNPALAGRWVGAANPNAAGALETALLRPALQRAFAPSKAAHPFMPPRFVPGSFPSPSRPRFGDEGFQRAHGRAPSLEAELGPVLRTRAATIDGDAGTTEWGALRLGPRFLHRYAQCWMTRTTPNETVWWTWR